MALESTRDQTALTNSGGTPWGAVTSLSLITYLLVALEFMPMSLLTPVARSLAISEGQAGHAITVSGVFAVIASLFGNFVFAAMDRKSLVVLYTAVLAASSLIVALAPDYVSFMIGRALVGVSIGGFWSLSTALVARVASGPDLPKAIALLQGGSAFAIVTAAPLASFIGGLIGWRGVFLATMPIGLAALVWQLVRLPKMPAAERVSLFSPFALLRHRMFAIAMAAITLAFMGQNALFVYLRPFLESVTGLDVNALSMVLLGLGLGGLAGTFVIGFVLQRHLSLMLIGLPGALAILAVLLIAFGHFAAVAALLLVLWGLLITPIPVAWNTWMTKVVPDDLEAGGGLQVALIQLAVGSGAFAGGVLFDSVGWWSSFVLAAVLLTGSAALAARVSLRE